MKMNTPTAIFLGLTLIAAAIFFRQPSISEAQANNGIMRITLCNPSGTKCAGVTSNNRFAVADGTRHIN